MNLNNTQQDIDQWNDFHQPSSVSALIQMKQKMHDELSNSLEANIESLNEITDGLNSLESIKQNNLYDESIIQAVIDNYKLDKDIIERICNFYLIIMDINTYACQCLIADKDWEWRVFARHILTIMYEHKTSVFNLLNDICKDFKQLLGDQYNIRPLLDAKKDFVSVIKTVEKYALNIRINVDAHFRGDFKSRLSLIENMSYYQTVKLIYFYWAKLGALLHTLLPIIVDTQKVLDQSLVALKSHMSEKLGNIQSADNV